MILVINNRKFTLNSVVVIGNISAAPNQPADRLINKSDKVDVHNIVYINRFSANYDSTYCTPSILPFSFYQSLFFQRNVHLYKFYLDKLI